MKKLSIQEQSARQGEVILYQPDESIRLEVLLDGNAVWLNRQQMASLFDRDVKTIGKHINNALQNELRTASTVAHFATVQQEGNRMVNRTVEFYGLDMVMSVGARIKSPRGMQLKQWIEQFIVDRKNEIVLSQTVDSENNSGEIVMYQPDDTTRLEVRMENETVWLTQAQIIELFQSSKANISEHIKNIYEQGELVYEATVRNFRTVQQEGGRTVERLLTFYNLDTIISVGFRVNAKRGIKFRQWANGIIKSYMLRGYAINQRLLSMERHFDARLDNQQHQIKQIESTLADHQEKIDFFVRTNQPPVEGIFYDGQIFDAYVQISDLIKQAKKRVVLIDNYNDETTLTLLNKRGTKVDAIIYTRPLSQQQQLDVQRNNQQYPPITVKVCQQNHDRFLIIDDAVYAFGASLKDAGKKLFAYIKMNETTAAELLRQIR